MKSFLGVLVLITLSFVTSHPYSGANNNKARLGLEDPNLFDGDIILPVDNDRNGIPGKQYRWPNKIIPYVIDPIIEKWTSLIEDAMEQYHINTCVRFVPRTDQRDYIYIHNGTGCSAHLGRIGGEQSVKLGQYCGYIGTIMHELGHAIGFDHEHNRSDRDKYITIFLENVKLEHIKNFIARKPENNIIYTPFDHHSIMIYGNYAFTSNKKPTMISKDGTELIEPYDKEEMTADDIKRVNMMYECTIICVKDKCIGI